jgi:hypothetical protein
MINKILQRICHFLSLSTLEAQVIVLDTMIAAFRRLANKRRVLLPEIHKAWPYIIQRLKGKILLLKK